MGLGVIVGLLAVLVVWGVGIYNGLVRLRNAFKNAFAQIDVQLKRRYELIPNLVETAKSYMKHEKQTLEAVIAARNSAHTAEAQAAADPSDPEAMRALSQAEGRLTTQVGKMMALFESYPDLKANTTMVNLMEELSSTENKVAFARQAFNDSVMSYNNQRETFPNNLIANNFGFQPAQLLQVDSEAERAPVRVSFDG
jgi:LemA protein